MKRENKVIKYSAIGLLIIMALLFIVGTFFDLNISKKFADVNVGEYYTKNNFVNILEAFSELPVYLLVIFSVGICGYNLAQKEKAVIKKVYLFVTAVIIFCVGMIGAYRMVGTLGEIYDFQDECEKVLPIICYCLFALLCIGLEFLILTKISKETIKKLYYFCWAVIVAVALTFIFTQVIKTFWSRLRFRALKCMDDYSQYRAWCKPLFHKKVTEDMGVSEDAYKSFPSGHSSFVASLLIIGFISKFMDISEKAKYFCFFIPVVYLIIIAISRIVAGAHYLTDVLAGSGLAVLINYLSIKKFKKIYEKKKENGEIYE